MSLAALQILTLQRLSRKAALHPTCFLVSKPRDQKLERDPETNQALGMGLCRTEKLNSFVYSASVRKEGFGPSGWLTNHFANNATKPVYQLFFSFPKLFNSARYSPSF
ncbi:hypothetical protein BGZ60DRAFT_398353 [Tricladium varicosporioides]|nr:hypothetical protein BGZ60DRAFT_398353 [Hymenoscyphus varicosporioides]